MLHRCSAKGIEIRTTLMEYYNDILVLEQAHAMLSSAFENSSLWVQCWSWVVV